MLKVGLINDTRATANPGCIAVYQAIESLVGEAGGVISASLPVNYWAEPFRAIAAKSKDCVTRGEGSFPSGTDSAPMIDKRAWETIGDQLAASDPILTEFLRSSDLVIVNGEGSIHHNYPRALALLALVREIGRHGLPILLMNSTIQAMQGELLQDALSSSDFVHVREDSSRDLLSSLGVASRSAVDLAFQSIARLPLDKRRTDHSDDCLVTAGVLAKSDLVRAMFRAIRAAGLKPSYLCIGDGGELASVRDTCREEEVPLFHASDFGLAGLLEHLLRFRVAVSGRHHMNIFLMRARVPFVPLPSNTWKIEATLKKVCYPVPVVKQVDDLTQSLGLLSSGRQGFSESCSKSFACGVNDVEALFVDVLKCMS